MLLASLLFHATTVTAVFASFIAGLTSEGGASVFFPIMTIALDVLPKVARDFSLMIQVHHTMCVFSVPGAPQPECYGFPCLIE